MERYVESRRGRNLEEVLDELEERLAELPADREVVAYCRGPFCAYAHEAVRRLRRAGMQARRLEDGWPEWRLATETRAA